MLTEPFVAGMLDFPSLFVGTTIWDRRVPGLTIHVGRRRMRWEFFKQHRRHGGPLQTVSVTLGYWPEVSLKEARSRAMIQAGKIAAGHVRPGQKSALKVAAAIDQYVSHLRDTAKAGSRWPDNVVSVAKVHVLPILGRGYCGNCRTLRPPWPTGTRKSRVSRPLPPTMRLGFSALPTVTPPGLIGHSRPHYRLAPCRSTRKSARKRP